MRAESWKNNVEFYEMVWADEWQDMERFNPTARHLERMIVDLIARAQPVSSVLDVGCGMGVNVKRVRRHFPEMRIEGSDLSEEILDVARQYVGADPAIRYSALDLAKGTLPREFDLVLCSQVLEHIEDDRQAIHNLAAMSRKHLLITVPAGAYNSSSNLVGHYRHYDVDDLVEKVKSVGFEVTHVREWGFPFHSLYKWTLGKFSESRQKKIGLGKYGPAKRLLSSTLYGLFFGNFLNKGANIVLMAERP